MMKRVLLLATLLFTINKVNVLGQAALLVLIFFGEKAASENFYFSLINNIKLSESFYLTPEFLTLSPRGVKNVEVLTTGNPDLDDLLGEVNSSASSRMQLTLMNQNLLLM
ncbi:MAG: hypothetical protein GY790_15135 [Bacteroidetes bacterium]|nr:hypothetical protein [Bacteroidota bacterium]